MLFTVFFINLERYFCKNYILIFKVELSLS